MKAAYHATLLAVLAAYFHTFTEWMFFATKTSFLDTLGVWTRIGILFGSAALIAIPTAIFPLMVAAFARWGPARVPDRLLAVLGLTAPAAVLAACFFLLIDNFTYTVLGFGALLSDSARWSYTLLYVFLFVAVLRLLLRLRISDAAERGLGRCVGALLLASAITFAVQYATTSTDRAGLSAVGTPVDPLPNILLLASDGVEARHMSAYGSKRETTPFIRSWMGRALVAENAFPNATATAGSVVSMLTSKLSTHTRLYQHYNILTGRDSYEHLPGILRDIGYRTTHTGLALTSGLSALPKPWNMQNAFDAYEAMGTLPPELGLAYSTDLYFSARMVDRIVERLGHSVDYGMGNEKLPRLMSGVVADDYRIDAVLDFIQTSESPTFTSLHLMGTHTPLRPSQNFFSGGTTKKARKIDLYDSTIRDFDDQVEMIVGRLRESGDLENTIVVLTSDHGRQWNFARLPLMFFFPNGEHRGVIRANVSLIDVAPTILDYLGLTIPPWMEGQSLLAGEPEQLRPIHTVTVGTGTERLPQIRKIGVTTCNLRAWFAPRAERAGAGSIGGHTDPCLPASLPPPSKLYEMTVSDLIRSGYDASRLAALAKTPYSAPAIETKAPKIEPEIPQEDTRLRELGSQDSTPEP